MAGYIRRWHTRLQTVTHPSSNRARRMVTSFVRRTTLTNTPRCQPWKKAPSHKEARFIQPFRQNYLRQTVGHRWTQSYGICRASVASRGKNWPIKWLYNRLDVCIYHTTGSTAGCTTVCIVHLWFHRKFKYRYRSSDNVHTRNYSR